MKKTIQLFPSGIPIVDSAWGGFYHGGTYLLVGEKKSGKTLLSIQFAVECAKQKEVCLYFTNSRPKDLMIHAASIDIDLENYINENSIIVVRVATPSDISDYQSSDEFLSEYLQDIISVITQYDPTRIVFDELTPYVEFDDMNYLREVYSQTIEKIEDLGVTSLLVLREPAAPSSKLIFNIVNSYATGILQLHKKEEFDAPRSGVIDITPNIGHTEGKFKANYFIEPYKGVTTDFKITKRTTKDYIIPKSSDKYQNISDINLPYESSLIPNIYSINDFKLIMNNQIALYQTTGQLFTIVSLKLNPSLPSYSHITFNQLRNAVRLASDKKDKTCVIGEKIFVLITKSDENIVGSFIAKVKNNLPSDDPRNLNESAKSVAFFAMKVNNGFNSAEELLNEFDLEEAKKQLDQ